MKRSIIGTLTLSLFLALVLGVAMGSLYDVAHAQGVGSGVDPAGQLANPVTDPGGAFSDLAAAKKLGWVVLAFAVLVTACKAIGSVASDIPWLAWLAKGKTAVIVAGVAATAAAVYNALATGGSFMAAGVAGVVAVAHYLDSGTPPAPKA